MSISILLISLIVILYGMPVLAGEQPTIRELAVEVDSLRRIMDERVRLYAERDISRRTAVDAALTAAKEQTASSFAASKEAIIKAEQAQHDYNVRSNEFRGQLDDQAKLFISRVEVGTITKNIEEKLARLEMDTRVNREAIGNSASKGEGMNQFWQYLVTIVGLLGSFGLGIYITRKKETA
jgi:hypothetical protein